MLISYNGELVRLQCAFVDTPEVDAVVDYIGEQRGYPQTFCYRSMWMKKKWKQRCGFIRPGFLI